MIQSHKSYDWLGHGVYFWEDDPERAREWAAESAARPSSQIQDPAVLGAVIDLGRCLDTSTRQGVKTLQKGYLWLKALCESTGTQMPENVNVSDKRDWLKRYLDCAVIESVHGMLKTADLEPFDSIKGLFTEGSEAYKGSAFREKTHTQICIINLNCIKGVFIPRKANEEYSIP